MRAACYSEVGPAARVLRVEEVETPEPGPGQVRVRVAFHGVNPTDVKRRAGDRGPPPFDRMIPGYDAAGEIDAVGQGIGSGRVGERVWVWEGVHRKWDGTAAEYVVVPDSRAMALPPAADFELGASLGVPGITAAHALRLGGEIEGQVVIVTGGAGAVGLSAVAIAAHRGARVLATVRDPDLREVARDAGAEVVTGADPTEIETAVKDLTSGKGAAAMLDVDLGAHLARSWRWVANNGTIASYGSASNPSPTLDWPKFMYRNIAIRGVAIFEVPEQAKITASQDVQAALAAGRMPRRIASVHPLEDVAKAHERQENRPRGKVLVQL